MQLVWFRDDLRVQDHPALWTASQSSEPVIALFVMFPAQWQSHHCGERKAHWHYAHAEALKKQLQALGIPLLIWQLDWFADLPDKLNQLCDELNISAVHCHSALGFNERKLEQQLHQRLTVPLKRYQDANLLDYDSIRTGQGGIYHVFTPFSRRSKPTLLPNPPLPAPYPQSLPERPTLSHNLSALESTLATSTEPLLPAGEAAAQQGLREFCQQHLHAYQQQRDFPNLNATSLLSPYFSVGALSPRQALHEMQQYPDSEGAQAWLNELLWREFYRYLLHHYPKLSCEQALYPRKEPRWISNTAWLERWQQGMTGYPMVDAGMRQLNATGWMHNRVRMLCASFLVKDLHIDWRLGEAYFMQQLLDGDLASNNGGWQWAAGCGADAAPYFRHFNPHRQSTRFDVDAHYIKTWVPELAQVPSKQIHTLGPYLEAPDYPAPMVDHKAQSSLFTQTIKQHNEALRHVG